MKIGMFVHYFGTAVGGIEESLYNLRKSLEEMNHEVYIICKYAKNINLDPSILNDEHIIITNDLEHKRIIKEKDLIDKIVKLNLDILHIHSDDWRKCVKNIKKITNALVFYTFHIIYFRYYLFLKNKYFNKCIELNKEKSIKILNDIYSKLLTPPSKILKQIVDYGISISNETTNNAHYLIGNKPLFKVPTAIDFNKYINPDLKEVNKIKEKYDLNNSFNLISVSRIQMQKRIDLLIKNFKTFKDRNIKLLILGDTNNKYYLKLAKLVKKYNLDSQIIFVGKVKNKELKNYFKACDLFVLNSIYETQGLVYFEALSASLPLLVYKNPALDDFLIEGKNGLIYKNEEEFIEKLNKIIEDKELYNYLKSNARNSIESYDLKYYGKNMEAAYKKALDNKLEDLKK